MKEAVKEFFESGKLEKYLMGLCSFKEKQEVEHFINSYPEVKRTYETLQKDIESYAKTISQSAPAGLKADIMQQINDANPAPTAPPASSRAWPKVAALLALAGIALAGWFWNSNTNSHKSLEQLQTKYDQLLADCGENDEAIAQLQNERALLMHPATQTVVLKGDAMGTDFYAAAFWNKEKTLGHIHVDHLPAAPDKHCFQLWADVDGEMINLGVLPKAGAGMVALPYKLNATSLNVTIEPLGGSEHPTVSRLVASAAV